MDNNEIQNDAELKTQLVEYIEKLADTAHGNKDLVEVKNFISSQINKKKKRLIQRVGLMSSVLVREPILFEDVKDRIWDTEELRVLNRFPFLQGDVVETTAVSRVGSSLLNNRHSLWLVLTPTCDIVRRNFVRVAPLHKIYVGDGKSDEQSKIRYELFALGLKLASPRAFSIPILDNDSQDCLGMVAVFDDSPSYITCSDKGLAVQRSSLTIHGWHLLNAVLQQRETRANMAEEMSIRSL